MVRQRTAMLGYREATFRSEEVIIKLKYSNIICILIIIHSVLLLYSIDYKFYQFCNCKRLV